MDAMSDAIEGADVMLYGVSLRYKESANVSGSRCHGLEAERTAADPESRSCMIGGICRGGNFFSADWRRTTLTNKSWT